MKQSALSGNYIWNIPPSYMPRLLSQKSPMESYLFRRSPRRAWRDRCRRSDWRARWLASRSERDGITATGGALIGDAADLTIQRDFTDFANIIADKVPLGGAVIVADVTEDGMSSFRAMMQVSAAP
jgi:hypothetical protein